jgi:hypothetical protein
LRRGVTSLGRSAVAFLEAQVARGLAERRQGRVGLDVLRPESRTLVGRQGIEGLAQQRDGIVLVLRDQARRLGSLVSRSANVACARMRAALRRKTSSRAG